MSNTDPEIDVARPTAGMADAGLAGRGEPDVKLQAFGPIVPELMRSAAELASSTDYQG